MGSIQKDGTVTVGNAQAEMTELSSSLVTTKEKALELGYDKALKIVSQGSAGVDPNTMGLGPIPATKKALEKAGLTIDDIDVIELNEVLQLNHWLFQGI